MGFTYKLNFKYENNKEAPKTYQSDKPVEIGDAIHHEDGFWYAVIEVLQMKTGTRLTLAKSAQDAQEAHLLAEQLAQEKP